MVYGTQREAGANRYAAEHLQEQYLDGYESQVPIYKDFEVTDDTLRKHDVVFVGRPESNSALAVWSGKLGLEYSGGAFKINGETHTSEREGLILAAKNPLDGAHMVLVVAGNSALSTVKSQTADPLRYPWQPSAISGVEYVIVKGEDTHTSGFIRHDSSITSGSMKAAVR